MTNDEQVAEIAAFYDKLRAKLAKEHNREIVQLQRARDAALKVFVKPSAPAHTNGLKAPRVRGSRLDPEIQKLILAAMSTEVGYTTNEIADLSHAGRSQVKAALAVAMKAGTVAGDTSKRNRKFVLTATVEQANA
jgi:hypothetical protein